MKRAGANREKVAYEFIQDNRTAALATVSSDGIPHVATIYCVVYEDLSLYFMTRVEGRKFANLTHHPKVAMVFSNEGELGTLQLTGKAEQIANMKKEQAVWQDLMRLRTPLSGRSPVPAIQLFERGATNELAIVKVIPYEMTFATFEQTTNDRYKPVFQKII